ncbi:MAG TPA: ATP-binding protein [Vulgatibacter sp.]|nr:ATP-binding protein [Vulgatibacter sp.]
MATRAAPWEPSEEESLRILGEQNPWHSTGRVPEGLAARTERALARMLARRLSSDTPRRFQLVLGPRRVGKTTAMYQTVRHLLDGGVPAARLWWFRLDHPILLQRPLEDLVRIAMKAAHATESAPVHLFLDELTYARDWDLWLKTFYDERWPLRIAGTSSATAALRERHLESGVGRWEEQYLAPYLFDEFLGLVGRAPTLAVGGCLGETLATATASAWWDPQLAPLRQRFSLIGGFPELLLLGDEGLDDETYLLRSQRVLRSDAVERAIYKDIPQAFGVGEPILLERLLYVLAGQMTGVLSPTAICKNLGLSQPTFDRYLSFLERAFIVFTLPNFSGNETKVQRRGRKLYFVDGAVRNAALQRGTAPLVDPQEMGLLNENLAASHLYALARQSQVRLFHWKDGKDEVDLIYDDPARPLAFEIGSSPSHHRRGLAALVARFPRFDGGAWYVAPGLPARAPGAGGDPIGTLPLELLLLAAGRQAAEELTRRLAPNRSIVGG